LRRPDRAIKSITGLVADRQPIARMPRLIFISYSSKDQKAAETLCSALESRGFSCWIAARDVHAGEDFQEAIVNAIERAKAMVLVFTENANNSDEIKKEMVLAGQYDVVVIPVRVEDIRPRGAFAYQLATRQWIDLFDDWERGIQRLAARVAALIEKPAPPKSERTTEPSPAPDVARAAVTTPLPPEPASAVPRAAAATTAQREASPRRSRRTFLLTSLALMGGLGGAGAYWGPGLLDALLYGPEKTIRLGGFLYRAALSTDGKFIALVRFRDDEYSAEILDTETWRSVRRLENFGPWSGLQLSPDGQFLAGTGVDNTLGVWDFASGRMLQQMRGHADRVYDAAFSPDGRWIASASRDRTIKLWDARTGGLTRTFTGHTNSVTRVAFTPDGKRLVSGSIGAELRFWNFAGGAATLVIKLDQVAVDSIAFSQHGKQVAIGGQEQEAILIYNAETGEREARRTGWAGTRSVAFSPDGQWLAAGGGEEITLWTIAVS
jgi:hypothetical protein